MITLLRSTRDENVSGVDAGKACPVENVCRRGLR
jgi:hypothetical protein